MYETKNHTQTLYLRHHLKNRNHFNVNRFAAHVGTGDDEEVIVRCGYLKVKRIFLAEYN